MSRHILARISRRSLEELSVPPLAVITNVKQLSSYSWIEASTPTIAVPGIPPLWFAPKLKQQVEEDPVSRCPDQNIAHYRERPLEPLFRALYIANPSFDIGSIDVVTDRTHIINLYAFINPEWIHDALTPVRFNIELRRKTAIFFSKKLPKIHPSKTFSQEFVKACTLNQISGNVSHQRVISYQFSNLNFIMRHEAAAYMDSASSFKTNEAKSDCLSTIEDSSSGSSNNSPIQITSQGSKLTIHKIGQLIPHGSIVEIKTSGSMKHLEKSALAPELWVSQTWHLARALHYGQGHFDIPRLINSVPLIKEFERNSQQDLTKLAALINRILDVAKRHDGKAFVRYDVKKDELVIAKVDQKHTLPKDLYSKWEDRGDSEAEINMEHDAGAERSVKSDDGV